MIGLLLLVLLAFLGRLSDASVIASGVDTCQNNDPLSCQLKTVLLVYLDQRTSGAYQFSFTFGTNHTLRKDADSAPYAPTEPISLSLYWRHPRYEHVLVAKSSSPTTVFGVEVVRQTYAEFGVTTCPSHLNWAKCCLSELTSSGFENAIYYVRSVNPEYKLFHVGSAIFKWDVEAVITQGNSNPETLTVDYNVREKTSTAGSLYVKVASVSEDFNNRASFSSYYYTVPNNDATASEFLVDTLHIGDAANKIGIEPATFKSVVDCDFTLAEKQALISVQNSATGDQFSPFRTTTMTSKYQTKSCSSFPAFDSVTSSGGTRAFSCSSVGNVQVVIELDAASFQLTKLVGLPSFVNVTVYKPLITDMIVLMDFVVKNDGDYDGNFDLRMDFCCLHRYPNDFCDSNLFLQYPSVQSKSVAAGSHDTFRVVLTTIYETAYYGGECNASIAQFGEEYAKIFTNWSATGYGPTVSPTNPPVNSQGNSNTQAPVNGSIHCTADQFWTGQYCHPVNCTQKYGGSKSFYNSELQICERVIRSECSTEQTYDETTNECVLTTATGEVRTRADGSTHTVSNGGRSTNLTEILNTPPADCGHGTLNGTFCVCNPGFITAVNQDIFNIVWCNETVFDTEYYGVSKIVFSPMMKFYLAGGATLISIVSAILLTAIRNQIIKPDMEKMFEELYSPSSKFDNVVPSPKSRKRKSPRRKQTEDSDNSSEWDSESDPSSSLLQKEREKKRKKKSRYDSDSSSPSIQSEL